MTSEDPRIAALSEAVRIAPADAGLHRLLADSLAAAGRHDEAIQEFREALAIEPRDPGTMLALARAYCAVGKPATALVVLEDRAAHVPEDAEALLLQATVLADLGRANEAARVYRTAIAADPRVADPALAARIGAAVDPDADEDEKPVQPSAPRGSDAEPREQVDELGRVRVPAEREGGGGEYEPDIERPRITFADVGGMDSVKDEIRMKIIHPLEHPDLYAQYGKSAGGGILLYGPPGCGKTHLARATAGEVRASFLGIGISDVLDMWIGSSEKNLHAIFDGARSHRPAVLFFDEVDALAARRTDFHGATGRNVVNQFLSELDGIEGDNREVLVLAATNAPWHLDAAFRRPGRFDRVIFVPPPDVVARAAIVEVLLRDRPVASIDAGAIARKTDGFSGADLKGVVDVAIEAKLRAAIREGIPTPIGTNDLLEAAKQITPSTREWFSTARNYVLYANDAGLYDPVRPYLKL